MAQPTASNTVARDIVFVDSRVQDSAVLLQKLPPGAQVIYLRAGEDGLAQMAAALGARGEVDGVHILAHGSEGQLWLGTTFLDRDTLSAQGDALAALGRGLTADGDILVYACNLASGDAGAAFVARLADLTGADVAASSNLTGMNGDWNLEIATGSIAGRAVLDASALQQYGHSLATLTVTTGLDTGADTTIGASLAADTSDGGGLSLREALNWASANDTITFNAGMTVQLNSALVLGKNVSLDGDLDNDNVADVTLDAQYKSQVVSVSAGTTATLEGLVITHGMMAGNGGNGGDDAMVAKGGGIYNAGTLTLDNVMISENAASGGGGGGGVTPDYAGGGGGGGGAAGTGIGGRGGDTLNSTGSTGSPGAGGAGGGFFNTGGRGGTSTGGVGGAAYPGYSTGSAGGTANAGTISIGGGGGGNGYDDIGGAGAGAVGAIYNNTGAILKIIGNSVISNNVGAGGGGGGGGAGGAYYHAGGAGGVGVGAIWNKGSVLITAVNYAAMTDNVGGSGIGGTGAGVAGVSPASVANVYGDGGTIDTNYVVAPTASIVVADTVLAIGETSLVTITFSEAVTGFTNADLTAVGGATLSIVTSGDGGVTWTATLTPNASITDTTNVITLDNTGIASSGGTAGVGTTNSNNYAIDTVRPTATVAVADTALKLGETSLVTFTFSEAVSGFTTADLTVDNGAVTGLSSSDGGITWTGTLTPGAGVTDTSNIITLNNATVADLAGNAGSGTAGSNNYAIDTVQPTATIVVADSALSAGETSLVTITFSEAVSGFSNGDLAVANGTLSAVSSADGGVTWSATLTPTASIVDTSNIIQLNNTGVSDAAGNAGTGTTDSNNYAIDTTAPTATIVVADSALAVGETSLVTITFSEAVSGFDNDDLAVANGSLSAVSSSDGGTTWSATFTPTADVTDSSNVITLANSGVQNLGGNAGVGTTNSNNYAIDTTRPTAAIVVADLALTAGETSLVTVTFSEAVSGFTTADLTADHGAVAGLSSGDGGITWTGTYTPDTGVADATNLISLANTGVFDAAGNSGSGTTDSANFSVNTVRPTVAVTLDDSTLAAGETTGVTFTFSEAVTGFDNADIAVANGTLGAVASADGGVTWTATLTPSAGVVDASNVLTVANTGYTNAAGNSGSGSTSSVNYTVSTVRPTVAVTLSDSALKVGETATVTFSFSEAVSGFSNSDVSVANGTLTSVSSIDGGVTWTALFTPSAELTDASNVISVSNAGFTNGAGNAGAGQSDSANYAIDTDGPDATLALSDSALAAGETALLTITFDQAVSAFSGASINVANGSLSGLASSDGGITWTATLTPSAATADASNVVSIDMSGLSDLSGNTGSGLASSANYTVDTVRPSATVVVADNALLAGETSLVTITFSQAVTGLGIEDFNVANGNLTGLATADGGVTWTATLAPTDGIDDTSNVITLDNAGYASTAGSTGSGTTVSNNFALATARPGATIVVSDALLGIGATTTVTITFSEPVSGFTNADLTVGSGSLSPVSSIDGGVTWVATLTPSDGVSSSGNVITLNNTGVQDGDGNTGAATTSSNPYAVDTRSEDPEPVPDDTVDGVPVFSDVVTDPATGIAGTVITVPFVPTGRNDDPATPNSSLADIPLGVQTPAGSPQVDLVVSLPAGAGLRAEGPNVLLSNAQGLIDLINRIEGKTVAGSAVQQEMAGQGVDFLGALGSEVVLETMTLVPVVAPGATLAQPIVITGSSTTPANGTENATAIALVIDATGLPANAVLQLDNVDFAAIVGAATLRGGSGENFVIGDGAAQNILLGADDDQLYGGGGNDIVGSAGGNDLLDGGSGNDIVVGGIGNDSVAGGSGDDVLQGGRSTQGGWQFFVDAAGNVKARHELAVFAPGSSELVNPTELNHGSAGLGFLEAPAQRLADIALLYRAVFGRVADLGGLEFWSGADATIGAIASAFGGSAEWASAGYDQLTDAGFVSAIYQNVLGRATDAGGAAFWIDKLAGGGGTAPLSRSEVLVAIALSDEHEAAASTADGIAIGAALNVPETDWFAGSGDDRLEGGQGNDTLVGGDGIDTVVYGGARTGYKILLTGDGQVQVLDQANGDLDTLSGIEAGLFADGAANLAFTQEEPALLQQLGLLYQTLFDRAGDLDGMVWWAGQYSDADAAVLDFMATPEYAARYGSVSDTQLIESLYRNTGLQNSDAGGVQSWESYLVSHTRAELIASWIGNDSVIDAQFGSQGLWLA